MSDITSCTQTYVCQGTVATGLSVRGVTRCVQGAFEAAYGAFDLSAPNPAQLAPQPSGVSVSGKAGALWLAYGVSYW